MPFNLSTGEILVLLIVAILVFGGRLPEVARKVARGVGDFRRGMNEELRKIDAQTSVDDVADVDDGPPPEWSRPPDGADCDGFGRIDPESEETPDAATEEPEASGGEPVEEGPSKKSP